MAKKNPAKKTAPAKKKAASKKKSAAKPNVAKKKIAKKAASKKPAPKKKAPVKTASPKKKAPPQKVALKKKVPKKKAVPAKKKVSAKKPAKKAAAKKKAVVTTAVAAVAASTATIAVALGAGKKAPVKKKAAKKAAASAIPVMSVQDALANGFLEPVTPPKTPYKAAFIKNQKQKLWDLRDDLMDAMAGVTRDTLRSDNGGNDASGSGMHQADAGSDAYDRDFALQLLANEQDSLHEIESALTRIEQGYYGVCEMTGNKIGQLRLEAMPFCRYTVEYQAQLEREQALVGKVQTRPLEPTFGKDLTDKLKSSLE